MWKKSSLNNTRYARCHRLLALTWLFFIVSAAIFLLLGRAAWQGRIDTDLLSLLPKDEQRPALKMAMKALAAQGERQLALLVFAPGDDQTRQAAAMLRSALRASGLEAQDHFSAFPGDFYFPYRQGLLTPDDQDWLLHATPQMLQDRALNLAYAPFHAGGVAWQSDPFGFFGNWLTRLGEASPLRPSGGELMVEHAGHAYAAIIYTLPESAFADDFQARLMESLDAAQAKLRQEYPEAELLRAGVVLHAAAASRQAQAEMRLIGLGSLLGALFLIGFVFKSARALRLIVISLISGAITALFATLLIFDRLHLMTLVFGMSLIGVAVDYAILVFAQHLGDTEAVWTRHRRLLPTLCMALITPVLAYLGLALTPFPGLKQMAAFAAFGIFGAWMSVVVFYPYLLPPSLPAPASAGFMARLLQRWPRWRPSGMAWGGVLLVGVFIGGGLLQLRAHDDIRSLFSGDPALMAEQRKVSEIMRLPSPAQMFLVHAESEEALLQKEESLIDRLRPLMENGKISGFEAVSRWLPSEARQIKAEALREKLLPSRQALEKTLELPRGWARQTLAPERLTPALWRAHAISQPFLPLWLGNTATKGTPKYSSMVLLKGLADPEVAANLARLAAQDPALKDVEWIDQTRDISDMMQRYRRLLTRTLIIACLVAPLLLYPFFRREVWRIVAPVLLAGLLTLALMGYLDIPVQMLSILSLLLTLGMGVDYAIFLAARQTHAHTLLATTLAASLTLLSFGLLAFSETPALRALGLTATLGVTFSWFLTPVFRRRMEGAAEDLACHTLPQT
jgi:predicted exporter